jgi:hypothetical protein
VSNLQDAYTTVEGELTISGSFGEPVPLVISMREENGGMTEVLRLEANGDVVHHGHVIGNDKGVMAAFTNAVGEMKLRDMGVWHALCPRCQKTLRCEDAATRLGKPAPPNKDDHSIEAEVRSRLHGESDPTSSLFAYEGAALLRIIDRLTTRLGSDR